MDCRLGRHVAPHDNTCRRCVALVRTPPVPKRHSSPPIVAALFLLEEAMGAAGSVHSSEHHVTHLGADPLESSCLPAVERVRAAHLHDKYRVTLKRHEELLARERRLCPVAGYESTAAYTQPLMVHKMERSLNYLDDVNRSHAEDQRRRNGYAEMPVAALGSSGIRSLCALGDEASVACATSEGPVMVYNWREGHIVCRLRAKAQLGGHATHRTDGAVVRMATLGSSCQHLATGDETGFLAMWDLATARISSEARLHEGAVTGLHYADKRNWVVSTSTDTYIMVYDLAQQQVVDRAVPKSCTCGSGVPNSAVAMGPGGLLLVGGGDGKLRLWLKDGGPLRRNGLLDCKRARPTQIELTHDGHRAVVSTVPGDPIFCGGKPGVGGLWVFDLRMLSSDPDMSEKAVLANLMCDEEDEGDDAEAGVVDMALVQDVDHGSVAICLADGALRAVSIAESGTTSHLYDHDVVELCDEKTIPCALAAKNNIVFTATTDPSLDIWRRTHYAEPYGHSTYERPEPLPPLELMARVRPLSEEHGRYGSTPGHTLLDTHERVDDDRSRMSLFVEE